jgi:hypothetical protein
MPKAQPDHYYGFGVNSNVCFRCGILRRQRRHPDGQAKTSRPEWSSDGVTWTMQHAACTGIIVRPKGGKRREEVGTKNNPGKFDCYANAAPDEPLFVLLARDPDAPALIRIWAGWREARGEDPAKTAEARQCADSMEVWRRHQPQRDPNLFHQHLDVCEQCREHPFALCPVGVERAHAELSRPR